MLVILAEGRRRSPSSDLKAKFDSFHKQCEDNIDYCMKGIPRTPMTRKVTAVEAPLNGMAQKIIDDLKPKLSTYSGQIWKSMQPDELKNM